MYNIRNNFPVHAFKNDFIQKYYGIEPKCATTDNMQENTYWNKFTKS